jgi:hypothetical protein
MQASKELDLDFLDPLLEGYKFSSECALDPQEIQGKHRNKRRYAITKIPTSHSD